jgi:hypothetical protein
MKSGGTGHRSHQIATDDLSQGRGRGCVQVQQFLSPYRDKAVRFANVGRLGRHSLFIAAWSEGGHASCSAFGSFEL